MGQKNRASGLKFCPTSILLTCVQLWTRCWGREVNRDGSCSWGSKGVSEEEIVSAQSSKHTEGGEHRVCRTQDGDHQEVGSDITKGILQRLTLEWVLRMKRNLASERKRKCCVQAFVRFCL